MKDEDKKDIFVFFPVFFWLDKFRPTDRFNDRFNGRVIAYPP